MTQHSNSTFSFFRQRSLLQGLSWVGGLGILSSGLVLAQTPVAPETSDVPAFQDLPSESVAVPFEEPAFIEPAPVAPEYSAPEAAVPETPSWSAPLEESPIASPQQPVDDANAYIDRTDYSLGATSSYDEPTSVVLSERSTGCEKVLQTGQDLAGGVCGVPPQAVERVVNNWRPAAESISAASESLAPRNWEAPVPNYTPAYTTVSLGPIQLGPKGLKIGGTTASLRTYYKAALRPPGRLSNGNLNLMFPLAIPAPITSVFGWRIHPISGDRRFHSGTDLGAPLGTPVLAAYAGRVAIADLLGGYGLTVTLEHNLENNQATQETLYAHLSEIFVKPGEWIDQGAVIGRVGSTGNSTGPHLHFEFRQLTSEGWVALDPGEQLEYALAQLVKVLQTAQAKPQAQG